MVQPLFGKAGLGTGMMRIRFLTLLAMGWLFIANAWSEEQPQEVQVADPFLELHTGPGSGYPVTYVVERGEWIVIARRKTDWFEIRTREGREGWVIRSQLERTLTPAGEKKRFEEVTIGDFTRRRWEIGLMGGDFEGARSVTGYSGYAFTANLLGEISATQAVGTFSTNWFANASLVGQPFPEWRVSPFFSVGTGFIRTEPRGTLVDTPDRTDSMANVAAGLRAYVTRRFVFRAEYRNFVVFSSDDDNEDPEQWQLGFAVFF